MTHETLIIAAAVLAMSDGLAVGLAVLQLMFNVVMGVGLAWNAARTRRLDTLERSVGEKAEQLIDQKITNRDARLDAELAALKVQLQSVADRLSRGDNEFDRLGERDHEADLKLLARVDSLKDYIRDNCAGKAELSALSKKVEGLQMALARVTHE